MAPTQAGAKPLFLSMLSRSRALPFQSPWRRKGQRPQTAHSSSCQMSRCTLPGKSWYSSGTETVLGRTERVHLWVSHIEMYKLCMKDMMGYYLFIFISKKLCDLWSVNRLQCCFATLPASFHAVLSRCAGAEDSGGQQLWKIDESVFTGSMRASSFINMIYFL